MAEYRKQIAYLDYLEDGVKIKNAGFVRIEEQNGHNRMEVKVKNLPGKDCGEFRLQEEQRSEGSVCRAATETAAWCGGCRSRANWITAGRKAGSRLRSFGFYCPEKEC